MRPTQRFTLGFASLLPALMGPDFHRFEIIAKLAAPT
jgi:hypothetical protein